MSDDELRGRFRRDFTSEPIGPIRRQPSAQPVRTPQPEPRPAPVATAAQTVPTPANKPTTRRIGKKSAAFLVALLILGGAGGTFWFTKAGAASPVPAAVVSSVNFPVIYPSKLPAGYAIKLSSFSTAQSTLIYAANNTKSGQIAFSVQPRPSNFDFSSFYKQGLGNADTFDTPVGQAAIGKANGNIVGSLTTGQSWILISAPVNSLQFSDIKLILENLKTVSN